MITFNNKQQKETYKNKCISCLHFNRVYGINDYMGFCSYDYNFYKVDSQCPIFRYKNVQERFNRNVHIIMVDKLYLNDNTIQYRSTGIGISVTGNFTDYDLLIDVRKNMLNKALEICKQNNFQIMGKLEPVLFAEYIDNKYELVFNKLEEKSTKLIMNELNNINHSSTGD